MRMPHGLSRWAKPRHPQLLAGIVQHPHIQPQVNRQSVERELFGFDLHLGFAPNKRRQGFGQRGGVVRVGG